MRFRLTLIVLFATLGIGTYLIVFRQRNPQPQPPPIIKRNTGLPDPAEWIDPLDQPTQKQSLVVQHEAQIIPNAMTEDQAIAEVSRREDWITRHSGNERDFLKNAMELEQFAGEIARRWPTGKHTLKMRHLELQTAENFSPSEKTGPSMWGYCEVASISQKDVKPEHLMMSEVRRALEQKRIYHAMEYAKTLVAKAPSSTEMFEAQYELGGLYEHDLRKPELAKRAYTIAATATEAKLRVRAKTALMFLAVAREETQIVIEKAADVLKEPELKAESRARILIEQAKAAAATKDFAMAVSICKRIQREYPSSHDAQDAKEMEERCRSLVASELLK